ncbi:maltooligosyl trehalose hydrolase [Rubellimicrobium thermophilum DSM 16684]|uniref:Malto-oligosyltrehalose trehalohydrolase n=1 Tax=Rubellimicrobium thermophilum DSM 16684 TaxID=1123069 RepID=S9QU11_9RHOB|nr:malto-oligosyltrehalose trehalohydrolase [Rubellimicrobium thermophilum]EPX83113.1 maltooligosyl trehalose hydrolase [Rubellimicrobium thermophilum DSM 16684]
MPEISRSDARSPAPLARRPRRWGADPAGGGCWRFALWAPGAESVALDLGGLRHGLERDEDGFWWGEAAAQAGDPYAFVVDGRRLPDPMARAQAGPDPMGPSRLVDPAAYAWRRSWPGRPWEDAVLYELHIGTFTPEGTFAAARRRLPRLADLGITALELMPVAHFPGRRGWGYDGTLLFAPHPAYGRPDDLRAFVEAAQEQGIMVILDVVLNHFGPEGSAMQHIAPAFFDPEEHSPWGAAIAFGEPAVRAFALDLCLGLIGEYRLDGLRLDAVHEIRDPRSQTPVLAELGRAVAAEDWGRPIHLIYEDARNNPVEIRDGQARAQWADDFHHALHPILTGENRGWLAPFAENPHEKLRRVLGEGFAEPGKGAPEPQEGLPPYGLPWTAFVCHNQNHDQVGNRPDGARLITLAGDDRAVEVVHALLLCSPFVPMLWMGEEVGERGPFHYFCDVSEALAEAIRKGRREAFGAMFPEAGDFPDPNDPATFEASRPFGAEDGEEARHWRALTQRLLALRHRRIVPLLKSGRTGPARVERQGPGGIDALWPFRKGRLRLWVNLGGGRETLPPEGPKDLVLGDLAHDRFAIAVSVEAA